MAIQTSDIAFKLSGGASNSDPNASLGGVMSSTAITSGNANNLFDDVSGDEGANGDQEYRCFYVQNTHGSLTWSNVKVWISSPTPSADTEMSIGLDPAGVGDGSSTGVATTVGDESSAPAGVSFSRPTAKAGGLAVGALAPGEAIAVWIRRDVTAGATAVASDSVTVRAEGDTPA